MTKGRALSLQGLIGNSGDHTCTATMQGNCYTTAHATAPTMLPKMPRNPNDLSTELVNCSRQLPHVPTSPSHDKGRSPELTEPDRELGRRRLHCDNAKQLLHNCSYNWSPNGFQLLPFPDACRLLSNCLHHGLYTAPTIQQRFYLLRNYSTTLKTASQLP